MTIVLNYRFPLYNIIDIIRILLYKKSPICAAVIIHTFKFKKPSFFIIIFLQKKFMIKSIIAFSDLYNKELTNEDIKEF